MTNLRLSTASALTALILSSGAWAHIPIFTDDGSGTNPENAVFIDDASISHVVYHEITETNPQLWVTYDLEAGQEIYAQFGIPVLDRLEDFRPAFAILGPGLPAIDLPFDIPEGLGGILFETEGIAEPEFFHEQYTRTDSWIFGEIVDVAPESGTYFLVAYVPSGDTGKLWAAPGRREVFEREDIVALPVLVPKVRAFHEVQRDFGLPCFLPVAGFGLLLYGGFRLTKTRTSSS